MEYFIAINGEEVGPLSQYRVVQMLRDEEITLQHKSWHKELDDWMAIEDIPSMKSAVDALKKAEKEETEDAEELVKGSSDSPDSRAQTVPQKEKTVVPVATEVRPLLRFWARSFDYCIVFSIIFLFADFEFLNVPEIEPDLTFTGFAEYFEESRKRAENAVETGEAVQFLKMIFYSMLLWHVIEGLSLSVFGTTPGKALFGIRVLDYSQQKISMLKGIIRSFLVYFLGVGLLLIPLLTLATMAFAFFRLMAKGSTFWDSRLKSQSVHPPMSWFRIVLAFTAFVALMLIQQYLKTIL